MSDHWDGKRFFNPHADTDKRLSDLLRYLWFSRWDPWPEAGPASDGPFPAPPPAGGPSLTFLGHVTFLMRLGGCTLLTDPVFSRRAGPGGVMGPRRVRPPAMAPDSLPPVDAVLISHNHYDHLDVASLRALARRGARRAITGLGNERLLARAGLRDVVALDWWESAELPGGVRVTFVPAQHWSARGPFDRRRSLWGGFVVEAADGRVHFTGDSGYCPHFREIGARFPGLDVTLLPIGAYEPRWFMAAQHMNPEEAVRAFRDLGAARAVAMHFGTFRLTTEGFDAPAAALRSALDRHGVDPAAFRLPSHGETIAVRG
ncbi:MBL fold metallo-hydrolase [Azospirillum halopraeferens]|uniref:MBL fold metallo-hydrolase n=1 Tax=Azospirillum halopraeferens TaxID=34010 RepID=UPI00041E9D97|nr:MBL fold metallo-hydrolase [Azospirillum halopraeferens]